MIFFFFKKLLPDLGSIFYQIWRRNNSVLAYQWNCEEFHELEPDRPEFHGSKVKEACFNNVRTFYV